MSRNVSARTLDGRLSRRTAVARFTAASAAITFAALGSSPPAAQGASSSAGSTVVSTKKEIVMTDATPAPDFTPLTVMLVHGAFADASGWGGVTERLHDAGVTVTAPPNLLRGVEEDSAYISSMLEQIPGPVLLVGHSYGGVVISNAAAKAENVVGLVYVAAFAPDEGETLMGIEGDSKDSILNSSLLALQYPTGKGAETAVEFAIDPKYFHEAFSADLPVEQAAVMAAGQRPCAALAFSEKSGAPAWKSLPSWAVIPTGDKAAGTDVLRTMAKRAGATVTEVDGSHAIMISQPQAVTEVILSAINVVA